MDNFIKVGVSVVSLSNAGDSGDNFYIDGRYKNEYEMERIQVSMEKSSNLHIFALTSGMDRKSPEMKTPVSMTKELKKFHSKIAAWGGDIESELDQMADCVTEINNILYSISINDSESGDKPYSFVGLLMDDGKAAAISSGNSRIYLMRDGNLNQLAGDSSRIERLLRVGIISKEQAKLLSSKMDSPFSNGLTGIQKSNTFHVKDGDIFVLCSENAGKTLDEQTISEVLSNDNDADYISNLLARKAIAKETPESVSIMVIKVEQVHDSSVTDERPGGEDSNFSDEDDVEEYEGKSTKVSGVISAIAICVVIALSLYFLYKELWLGRNVSRNDTPQNQNAISDQTDSDTDEKEDDTPEQQEGEEGEVQDVTEGDLESGPEEKEPIIHIVQSGDTLQGISKKYYNDIEKYTLIMKANGLTDPDRIMVGQELIIPQDEE